VLIPAEVIADQRAAPPLCGSLRSDPKESARMLTRATVGEVNDRWQVQASA